MSRIAIVLTQGFADWEYALIGGTAGPFFGLETRYFSPTPGKVTSMGGATTLVSAGQDDLVAWQPAVVALIGGTIWESNQAPDLADFLCAQHAQGVTVGGICGATLALGRAGLLDHVAHTSNDAGFLPGHAKAYQGHAHYVDQPAAVADGRVITASGLAPVSFCAEVLSAAGLDAENTAKFRSMLRAEHL